MDEREVTDAMIDAAIEALGPCVGSCGEASPPQRCDIRDAIEAALAARRTTPDREAWQSIETAPKDGRTLLLGYLNACGKWRTVRGQWMSQNYIDEYWEDPDDVEPGWFETAEEAEDIPNCWGIDPSHWMPLPTAPTSDKGGA